MVEGAPQDLRPAALAILVLKAKAQAPWPSPQVTQIWGLPLAGHPRGAAPRDPGASAESSPSPRLSFLEETGGAEVGAPEGKGGHHL